MILNNILLFSLTVEIYENIDKFSMSSIMENVGKQV